MNIYSSADLWERFENYPEILILFDSKNNTTCRAFNQDSMDKIIEKYGDNKVNEFSVSDCDNGFDLCVEVE